MRQPAKLAFCRRVSIYIHINNTNPMVDAGSEASAQVREHGIEIAYDGMAFEL